MKKKLLSVLLAGSVVASMAVTSLSASATVLPDGTYEPGENVTCGTYKYYLAMPKDWYSPNTDTAGLYWWGGTDACGAMDGSGGSVQWPGYKAKKGDVEDVFYLDVPQDVMTVVWSNYLDGGMDESLPIYLEAKQARDAKVEGYADGDCDSGIYDTDWYEEMYESITGDKKALGKFADNFFFDLENYDEESAESLTFKMDNMIYVVDQTKTSENVNHKKTYVGEWYFYYGNGEYGTYPTKEESVQKGTFGLVSEVVKPIETQPTDPTDPSATGSTQPSSTVAPSGTEPASSTTETQVSKPGAPSTDPTSASHSATSDTATPDSTNGAVQTGNPAYAVTLLLVLAAVAGVAIFTRKKYSK